MPISPDDLVRRDVHYCVSGLVHTLATATSNANRFEPGCELSDLIGQAQTLCASIPDSEEAAIQNGWSKCSGSSEWYRLATENDGARDVQELATGARHVFEPDADSACENDGIDPYDYVREVFEHWIVSDWLADMLAEKGEPVDKDFSGLTIWGRTTTGQAIALDAVIVSICADLNESPEWSP